MQRARKYFLEAPLVTRIASGLYLLYIAVNMSRPLWFDEVWRAYQISNWKFIDPDNGSAPISPLFFLLTKMMTVISNNEITQRLIVIAVSLLLPFVTYYVMSRYFGRQIAKIQSVLIMVVPGVIQYSIENKPYVIDIFAIIILLYCYDQFRRHKVLTYKTSFIALFGLFMSLAANIFIAGLAIAGYIEFKGKLKDKDKKITIVRLLLIAVVALIYIVFGYYPQIGGGLLGYWSELGWQGKHGIELVRYFIESCLDIFQKDLLPLSSFSLRRVNKTYIGYLISSTMVIAMFISCKLILRKYRRAVPILVATGLAWVLILLISIKGYWTFGSNRLNIFLFAIMLLLLAPLINEFAGKSSARYRLMQTVFVGVLFFPLVNGLLEIGVTQIKVIKHIRNEGYFNNQGEGRYMDEMRYATSIFGPQLHSGDAIVSFHFMTKKALMYYLTDYQGGVAKEEELTFIHDSRTYPLPATSKTFHELAQKHQSLWVITGVGLGVDPTKKAVKDYTILSNKTYGTVMVAHLEKKR